MHRRLVAIVYLVCCWQKVIGNCISNPLERINAQAWREGKSTDEMLEALKSANPIKHGEILRVYAIFKACQRDPQWMNNVGKDGGCSYCHSEIDEADKVAKVDQADREACIDACMYNRREKAMLQAELHKMANVPGG